MDVPVGPGAGFCSANFGFLAEHDEQFVRLAALAERYFADDPNTSLIKLRQFSELLAQQVAARYGLPDNVLFEDHTGRKIGMFQ